MVGYFFDNDIARFQIAMTDPLIVHVLSGFEKLPYDALQLVLAKILPIEFFIAFSGWAGGRRILKTFYTLSDQLFEGVFAAKLKYQILALAHLRLINLIKFWNQT